MTWIKDMYVSLKGFDDINAEGCCTGKFISQGGISGRPESTGLGIYYGTKELLNTESFLKKTGLSYGVNNKTIIVQGFGSVGYWASKFFAKDGAKIVGIVEHNSAIYNPDGFDVDDVKNYFNKNGSVYGYPKAQ